MTSPSQFRVLPPPALDSAVYRGADNHIHELFWDKGGWHHGDLTVITSAPPAVGMPDGFEFNSKGDEHVGIGAPMVIPQNLFKGGLAWIISFVLATVC